MQYFIAELTEQQLLNASVIQEDCLECPPYLKNEIKHSVLDSLLVLLQSTGNKLLKGRSINFGLLLPEALVHGWLTPLEA